MRVLSPEEGGAYAADALSSAISCYLLRRRQRCVSSAALLEMTLVALRTVKMDEAADRLEQAHARRVGMRAHLVVQHQAGCTAWSKDWLTQHARQHWSLGRTVARILAGQVEQELTRRSSSRVRREQVLAMLAERVEQYGLVPACPLEPAAREA
jgi:hypothetical protein